MRIFSSKDVNYYLFRAVNKCMSVSKAYAAVLIFTLMFAFNAQSADEASSEIQEDLEADSLLDVLESNYKSEELEVVEHKTVREQLLEENAKKNQAIAEKSKSYVPEDPNASYLAVKKQALSEWTARKRGGKILSGKKEGNISALDNNLEEGLMGSFNKVGESRSDKKKENEEFVYKPKADSKDSGFGSLSDSFKKN